MTSRSSIMAHCRVCNEENWVWYAINSVIDYMDKVLVYDTGSTDKTVEIIKAIKSPKIELCEKGKSDRIGLTQMRQEMLDRTDTDWFLVLDGDEVWPKETIKKLIEAISYFGDRKDAVVVPLYLPVGDVFHYDQKALEIPWSLIPGGWGLKGWHNLRAIRRGIKGLCCAGYHGIGAYVDRDGVPIGQKDKEKVLVLKKFYFHTSFLPRSSSRKKDRVVPLRERKMRYDLGRPFSKDMKYPEVFYQKRPKIVPSPWRRYTLGDRLIGYIWRGEAFIKRWLEK